MPEVYRQPVLGVHDLVPPEGRVSVKLMNERGTKVLQEEKATNMITNHWNSLMKAEVRGAQDTNSNTSSTGYNFHGPDARLGNNTDFTNGSTGTSWVRGINLGLPYWNVPQAYAGGYNSLLLSESTEATDADEWMFPGTLSAFCYLGEGYAPSTPTKRASLVVGSSYRTPTALRYVAEWGTTYGNGTHNSVGIGGCTWAADQATEAYAMLNIGPIKAGIGFVDQVTSATTTVTTAWRSTTTRNAFGVNNAPTFTDGSFISGHYVSDTEWWCLVSGVAGNSLTKMDPSLSSALPTSIFVSNATNAATGLSVSGPTMTTIGAGTNRCGVTVIGSDLWLAYTGTLKRCVKPTNTTLSVTNTYTPAGIETLVDITTDGTWLYWLGATTVYKIDATTGAVNSTWTHGLAGTMKNIVYGIKPNRLWISYDPSGGTASQQWNASTASNALTARKPVMSVGFTTAGVSMTTFTQPFPGYGAYTYFTSGLVMPLSTDNKHWYGWCAHNSNSGAGAVILGPSHISRTVLGSPVVKTSANSMLVTYEFGFS